MRCLSHGKEKIGICYWCGKVLCPMCTTHQNGTRLFCEKCYVKVGHIKKTDRPFVKVRQRSHSKVENKPDDDGFKIEEYH